MRRALALALAVGALGAVVGLIAYGSMCGMRSQRVECDATGCGPPMTECAPQVNPLLWPALAAASPPSPPPGAAS